MTVKSFSLVRIRRGVVLVYRVYFLKNKINRSFPSTFEDTGFHSFQLSLIIGAREMI